MNGRYMLDTNILIAILADESQATNSLAQADHVFLPSIAIGELFYGARKSGRLAHN